MVNLTKRAIMESFVKLLNQYPFEKITVKDIVEECGVNRNTFYYHYHDIYDLLEEILALETNRVMTGMDIYESLGEAIRSAASFALENKRAVYHLYHSISRQQIDAYMTEETEKVLKDYLQAKLGDTGTDEAQIAFLANFYTGAVVGMITRWLDENMKVDVDDTIQKMDHIINETIEVLMKK